ncbi:alpha/beta hydrolase [Flavobacterium sp.]|uniref:alpha/beta fold hydrolase n=1 Tax=Flavobacterium sp. TaxID=239 RepID=UPI00286E51D0|nr:alpha/beta hydrolase [Flavobacterium sp.]
MNNFLYKNTKVSYSDSGKGSAIVLLHGFLENATMWDSYMVSFTEKYRVVTIDLLGHGKSDCLGYVHTMEDQAQMVNAVLQHLKIRKSIFVGHSMGGYVALAFAELYSENTKGFVLLNSTTYTDDHERKINRNRAIKMAHKEYASLVQISIANLFSIDNRESFISEINQVKKEALKTPLQGYIAAQEGMKLRKNKEHLLHLTSYPKLLILGKKDGVLNYEDNIKQIEGTNVQLVSFPDGHMSHIENRDELKLVLLGFLELC